MSIPALLEKKFGSVGKSVFSSNICSKSVKTVKTFYGFSVKFIPKRKEWDLKRYTDGNYSVIREARARIKHRNYV